MGYFENITKYGHEQVVMCHDKNTGLRAVIAIHSTILGPSLGGCRMWPFKTEEEAVEDALRLSRGMTYKNAAAGLNIGGGKAVIIGDPNSEKNEALFRAFGQFVESLGGRYITAEDVGTSEKEMEEIKMETEYVTGLSKTDGGAGDPSPYTALGTFEGIKASVKYKMNRDNLKGIRVAVQGIGHVGYCLCEMLHNSGAELIVSDIFKDKVDTVVKKFKAKAVNINEIYKAEAEVFAPCALGGVLNTNTIEKMKFQIVAGAANNQLEDEEKHSKMLDKKSILYAPDFIINAGGVINVYFEAINEYNEGKVTRKVKNIYNTLMKVYETSREKAITTGRAANSLAEKRIDLIGNIHKRYV